MSSSSDAAPEQPQNPEWLFPCLHPDAHPLLQRLLHSLVRQLTVDATFVGFNGWLDFYHETGTVVVVSRRKSSERNCAFLHHLSYAIGERVHEADDFPPLPEPEVRVVEVSRNRFVRMIKALFSAFSKAEPKPEISERQWQEYLERGAEHLAGKIRRLGGLLEASIVPRNGESH